METRASSSSAAFPSEADPNRSDRDVAFVLRAVLEGTASSVGEKFFRAAARNLAVALDMRFVVIGRCVPRSRTRIATLAVWNGDRFDENFEYELAGTPCENVMARAVCAYPDEIQRLFPRDFLLGEMKARAYVGAPLVLDEGPALGVLAALDDRPIASERIPLAKTVLEIFAARAAAELDRLDVSRALLEQQQRLEELVEERTTALQRSMVQLERSARLASLGTLASGIAHELNNPLGIIRLACESIGADPDDGPLRRSALARILENVERSRVIVRNVQRFARSEQSTKSALDLNACLRSSVELARPRPIAPSIRFDLALAEGLAPVKGNRTELLQVFVNLIQNALSAKGVGMVRIATERIPGRIVASVQDDGAGIAEADLPYLFDPFFTTRIHEGGTGLGLSICHGIVREHGGQIEVRSSPGCGSTFRVELPSAA